MLGLLVRVHAGILAVALARFQRRKKVRSLLLIDRLRKRKKTYAAVLARAVGDGFRQRAKRKSIPTVLRSFTEFSFGLLLLSCVGCGEPASNATTSPSPTPSCQAPAGVSNSPRTIDETVTLINALPKPLSLPCFLESLARPLEISASNSVFSAQPAHGLRSPRIFLFEGTNVLSVVPEGEGAPLLEFGEQRAEFRSLKAEIAFPVSTQLDPSAPYQRALYMPRLTSCGGCHPGELQESEISGVPTFVSLALRPRPSELVSLAALNHELEICDPVQEPQRCAMLESLLGGGQVSERTFPTEMATFGGG